MSSQFAAPGRRSMQGRIQKRDQPPPFIHIRPATHGRSIQMGQKRKSRPCGAMSACPVSGYHQRSAAVDESLCRSARANALACPRAACSPVSSSGLMRRPRYVIEIEEFGFPAIRKLNLIAPVQRYGLFDDSDAVCHVGQNAQAGSAANGVARVGTHKFRSVGGRLLWPRIPDTSLTSRGGPKSVTANRLAGFSPLKMYASRR